MESHGDDGYQSIGASKPEVWWPGFARLAAEGGQQAWQCRIELHGPRWPPMVNSEDRSALRPILRTSKEFGPYRPVLSPARLTHQVNAWAADGRFWREGALRA